MMYIAISLTLLALVAGTHLLSKSKTEAMGNFARWIAYAVIIISIGMLLCELGRTGMRMMHRGGDGEMKGHHMGMMQYCPPEMCGGVACMVPMGRGGMDCCNMGMRGSKGDMGCCKSDVDCCKGESKGKCCEEEADHEEGHGHMMQKDSMKMSH